MSFLRDTLYPAALKFGEGVILSENPFCGSQKLAGYYRDEQGDQSRFWSMSGVAT